MGGGAAGAAMAYTSAKLLQEDAQQFQTSFYKQRYQRQMEDMRSAGLNPILSYKSGVPGGATGSIASAGGIASSISAGQMAGVAMAKAQPAIEKTTEETGKVTSAKGLIEKQAETEVERKRMVQEQALAANASAAKTRAEEYLISAEGPRATAQRDYYLTPTGQRGAKIRAGAQDYGEVGNQLGKLLSPITSASRLRGLTGRQRNVNTVRRALK